jgi:hypothetical protein
LEGLYNMGNDWAFLADLPNAAYQGVSTYQDVAGRNAADDAQANLEQELLKFKPQTTQQKIYADDDVDNEVMQGNVDSTLAQYSQKYGLSSDDQQALRPMMFDYMNHADNTATAVKLDKFFSDRGIKTDGHFTTNRNGMQPREVQTPNTQNQQTADLLTRFEQGVRENENMPDWKRRAVLKGLQQYRQKVISDKMNLTHQWDTGSMAAANKAKDDQADISTFNTPEAAGRRDTQYKEREAHQSRLFNQEWGFPNRKAYEEWLLKEQGKYQDQPGSDLPQDTLGMLDFKNKVEASLNGNDGFRAQSDAAGAQRDAEALMSAYGGRFRIYRAGQDGPFVLDWTQPATAKGVQDGGPPPMPQENQQTPLQETEAPKQQPTATQQEISSSALTAADVDRLAKKKAAADTTSKQGNNTAVGKQSGPYEGIAGYSEEDPVTIAKRAAIAAALGLGNWTGDMWNQATTPRRGVKRERVKTSKGYSTLK